MKRRNFIKNTALASSLVCVPNILSAFHLKGLESAEYNRLVVIQLSGGNDGLNTIIPYRNDIYYKNRPTISIGKNDVIKLTDNLGLNKNLVALKNLYDDGNLSIINNVGYKNPNRSHFRSTDIWHTASDSNEYLTSGWLGRFLDKNNSKPYSGIEVDESLSLVLKGNDVNGLAVQDPKQLFRAAQDPYFKIVLKNKERKHLEDHNLGYLYKTMLATENSAKHIFKTTNVYTSTQSYPNNPLAKQLKTAAEFINSGLDCKVIYTSLGGFDTHFNQKSRQDKLLKIYSESIEAFVNDLKSKDTFKNTLILTFSEFGRRVKQNAANGTDHGTANNVFIIGENLKKKGFYNEDPNLSDLDSSGDLKYSIDFRRIYSTILDRWLDINDKEILNQSYKKLEVL